MNNIKNIYFDEINKLENIADTSIDHITDKVQKLIALKNIYSNDFHNSLVGIDKLIVINNDYLMITDKNKKSFIFNCMVKNNGFTDNDIIKNILSDVTIFDINDQNFLKSSTAYKYGLNLMTYQFGYGREEIKVGTDGGWAEDFYSIEVPYYDMIIGHTSKTNYASLQDGSMIGFCKFLKNLYKSTLNDIFYNSIIRLLKFLLRTQYENGGIPQYYPLLGNYHDHITLNDGVMANHLEILKIFIEDETFPIIDDLKQKILLAYDKSLNLLLDLQVTINGEKTIWAAQYDRITLQPAPGRSFEPISLSGGESSAVLLFLMSITNPSNKIKDAIISGCKWYEENKVTGTYQIPIFDENKKVIDIEIKECNRKIDYLWGRFYDLDEVKPIFVNRKGKKFYKLNELDLERKIGYNWLGKWGKFVLDKFEVWKLENNL